MYLRTREDGFGLGQFHEPPAKAPQPALIRTFASNVISYVNAKQKCQATTCAIHVPSPLRDQAKIDLVIFFHGLDTCSPKYAADPQKVVKNFRLNDQVDKAARKAALVVPMVLFNSEDRNFGFIRTAWSAAYINGFVEEVLDEIGAGSRIRPTLDHLIIAGHSAGYETLVPLAEQFLCGQSDTKKGALAKLSKVIALDIPHHRRHVDALLGWANSRPSAEVILAFAKAGDPPTVWKNWQARNPKATLPKNVKVLNLKESHCELPGKYIQLLV